jgi:radical SAM superfamily enzyme YgiQ (UPF0313 family)
VRAVLISTYDLGRQPFGLASPAAWLREAGVETTCLDLSRGPFDTEAVAAAALVGVFLPMHTATRLAGPVLRRVRAANSAAHLCAYGLYAPPNAEWLRAQGVETILGAEFEADLVRLARALAGRAAFVDPPAVPRPGGGDPVPRLRFRVPDRSGLPPLARYAALRLPDGSTRVVGYTEASRGCKHLCRHCPIVPLYEGRFRVVPLDVVLADVRQQVAAGAGHVTFGDPDFLNGPTHALRVVRAFAREFPGVTYDVTIKIEHLLRHADALPVLRDTGCALVTSAVESFDDAVLARLAKGHTRADVERAVALLAAVGIPLAPTFIAFTPWTTRGGYRDLLDTLVSLDLVEHVPPVQLSLRLLLQAGSKLLELPDVRTLAGPFDRASLLHPWRHPDPAMDALQREVAHLVARGVGASRAAVFGRVRTLAASVDPARDEPGERSSAGIVAGAGTDVPRRIEIPYLDEPWYC